MTTTETETPEATEYVPEEKYSVRLLMGIDLADSPTEAVEEFIERIVSFGLRGFVYRVTENATGKVFLVQEGVVQDESDLLAAIQATEEADVDGG